MRKADVKDSGSFYKETGFRKKFPVEPFNTYSNLVFLFIFIFWLVKIWGDWSNNFFILVCLPFILIAWFGGTMYHAKRNRRIWVVIDVYFIMVVAIIFSLYFWSKSGVHWYFQILGILPIIAGPFVIRKSKSLLVLSLGYVLIGIFILIPIIIFLSGNSFFGFWYIVIAFASSALGLFFRSIDLKSKLIHGTHWLWHVFGGIAVHFLITYIYLSSKIL